ncbi:MAG: hypothetical protein L3J74_11930 [Bacteroidales bacterium]|nr:hypothetical protein [Bacteroidales bacterium]
MVIVNNQLKVAKIKMAYILSFLVGIGMIIPIFVVRAVTFEHLIMSVLGIGLFLYFIYLLISEPQYIYMEEAKGKLQIKTYPARPVLRQYKAFEINLNTLSHFELRKSFLGLKSSLTLWIQTKKGSGAYPPLSLSALSKAEQQKISKYLSSKSINRAKNIIQL